MRDPWRHVGRLWTNGEPFLAVDAALRGDWQGCSNDDYDQVITLGWQNTSVPVGTGQAVLVGADGEVCDEGWMEVFETETGLVAIVQALGPAYPEVLARALGYPLDDDQEGDALTASSGQIAIFSAALDGTGPHSGPLVSARPGPVPPVSGPPSREHDPGLLVPALHAEYKLKVRGYTTLDEGSCFARWLLIPATEWEEFADDPWVGLALHAQDELSHHGAEVALLRDLYLRTNPYESCLVIRSRRSDPRVDRRSAP